MSLTAEEKAKRALEISDEIYALKQELIAMFEPGTEIAGTDIEATPLKRKYKKHKKPETIFAAQKSATPPLQKTVHGVPGVKPCCGSKIYRHKKGCRGAAAEAARNPVDPSELEDEENNQEEIELRCGECEHQFDGVLKPSTRCPQCESSEIYKMYP